MALFEVQKAVRSKLAAASGVTALVSTRIYDELPASEPTYPYIQFGEMLTERFDVKESAGWDVELTLHVWSRGRGKKQAQDVLDAIEAALNRGTLTVTGYAVVSCDIRQLLNFEDADGMTRHGVARLRVVLQ